MRFAAPTHIIFRLTPPLIGRTTVIHRVTRNETDRTTKGAVFRPAGTLLPEGVPDDDQAATNSEYAVINNQRTYRPTLIVPDFSALEAVLSSNANYIGAELNGALTAGGTPIVHGGVERPGDAALRCVATVHAAEPKAVINDP